MTISDVQEKHGWYNTYDASGKKINSLADSYGNFKSAGGSSFNLEKSGWVNTFDKNCKNTDSRAA